MAKTKRFVLTRNELLKQKKEQDSLLDTVIDKLAERSRRKRQAKKEDDSCTQAKIDKLMDERVNAVVASLQAEGRW